MTVQEGERVEYILKSIKCFKNMPDRVFKLNSEGKHDEVVSIACEMASELVRLYESELDTFPSPKK